MTWSDAITGFWSSVWPYLAFPAGFGAKVAFDHWATFKSNKAIEGYKAELRKSEAEFNRALKAQDDEIAALRTSVLGGLSARSAAVSQRKLQAVDRLWAAIVDLNQYLMVSKMMSPIKIDESIEAASQENDEGQRVRNFADMIWQTCGLDNMKPAPAVPDNERPFLTETAWARFSLYRSVITLPIFHLAAMKGGMSPSFMKSPQPLLDAAKVALPHYSELIDNFGVSALSEIIDDIRDLVLAEVRNIIAGTSVDADLEAASKIIAATRAFDEAPDQTTEIPFKVRRAAKV
jgi:hypothetical protein